MSKSHNKKRNSGLIYEFLVRTISKSLVEGDKKRSSQALRVLKRHFKKGTELYKEFRLINALINTTVSSEASAASIIQEAKRAARAYDQSELDRQKSLLIRNINHNIGDDDFYDQQVNEYRMYATIQTLLNDWRSQSPDIGRIGQYEDQLLQWLTTERVAPVDPVVSEETPGTSRLLMKVMMKKLNEKYSGLLNPEQKELIRAYAFSTANDDPDSMSKKLTEIRGRLISSIEEYANQNPDNKYVNDKLTETKEQLLSEDITNIDDNLVTRFMLYTKLESELSSEES